MDKMTIYTIENSEDMKWIEEMVKCLDPKKVEFKVVPLPDTKRNRESKLPFMKLVWKGYDEPMIYLKDEFIKIFIYYAIINTDQIKK